VSAQRTRLDGVSGTPTATAEDLSPHRGATGPLAGVIVADLSRVLAGPYATQILGDLGATVIKVESPIGDETRQWRPPEHDGVSTYFLGVNRNKRDVMLDFADDQDRADAAELLRRADVVIENFRPGSLRKFGLDYESVSQRNPAVVYASITGFGSRDGAHLPGYDLIVQGASGLMSLTGDPDGPAYRSGMSVFDITSGLHAVIGILAALRQRDDTGLGQHIEVNLLSTALSVMANHTSTYVTTGSVPQRMGNAHPSLFPYEPLPASDGEIIIVAANDRQFHALATAIGKPDLASDARFATAESRNRNREELRPLLVAALADRTVEEWFGLLTAAGVACGPINGIDGGVRLAERLGLDPVVQVGGESGVPMIRNAISFSVTTPQYSAPAPGLGQDDDLVRRWLRSDPEEQPT
jgi:crotonobetainyl-CoA:carnitine CoA-transferase CaiB-like acyl-CoA transferase